MNGAIVLCVWTQRDGEMSGSRDEKCKHFSDFQGGGGCGWWRQPESGNHVMEKDESVNTEELMSVCCERRRLSREGSVVNTNPAVQVLVWKQ